ncbi:CRISPR system Cascade subunit CasD [Rhodotorula toruloides]
MDDIPVHYTHSAPSPAARASPSRGAAHATRDSLGAGGRTDARAGPQDGDDGEGLLPHPFQVGLGAPSQPQTQAGQGAQDGKGGGQNAAAKAAEQSVEALLQDAIERTQRATGPQDGAAQGQQGQGTTAGTGAGAGEQGQAQVDHLELIRQASLGNGAGAGASGSTDATTNNALPNPPPVTDAAPAGSASPSSASASRPAKGPGSRARWTPAEDARLIELVKIDPPLTWNEIGARMGRPPTGCGMRWYKFLRERVAEDDGEEAVGEKDRSGGAGQAQAEASAEGQAQQQQQQAQATAAAAAANPQAASTSAANGLHPSGDMIVGGSRGQHDHAVFPPAAAAATGPSGSPRPVLPLPYVPADQLPPALPPAADLAGHPFPRDSSPTTKIHSNAGTHYLPATALVSHPPIPFKKNQVLRGRRTKDPKILEEEMKAQQEAARRKAEEMRAQSAAAEGEDDEELDEEGKRKKKTAARPRGKGSAGGLGAKGGTSKGGNIVHKCPAENCTAAFKRSEHLRRHYKAVHRGEKPFPCTVADCGKAFSRKDNLQQHQAMVHFVKALYHYPDGTTSTDPPEPGQEGVTTTFEAVDISKTPRGAQKLSRIKGKQEERAKEAKKIADERERGDREVSASASAEGGDAHAGPSTSNSHAKGVPPYVRGLMDASGVEGAYSVTSSMSPGPSNERGASMSNGDAHHVVGNKRGRSAVDSDAEGGAGSDAAVDKRLRLGGIDPALGGNGGFYPTDPALQALAAQVQHNAHAAGYDSAAAQQQQRDLLSALQRMAQQEAGGPGASGDDHHLELRPDFIVPGLEAFLNQQAAEAAQHGAGGGAASNMPIKLLTSPPEALSRDELASISRSTPSTFEGIPPLTRHHEPQGVRIKVEPAFEGFSGEGVEGALWVTEGALSFFSAASSTGLTIPYPHITLHAVSRQPAPASSSSSAQANGSSAAATGGACIYCQLEESEEIAEDDEGGEMREMWITPEDEASVDKIFSALSLCASLHPSASDSLTQPSVIPASAHASSSGAASDSQASLFASMGLDPCSMVYATADGGIAGPGLALMGEEEGQWDDVEEGEAEGEEQAESSAGRTRSDFVNEGRARGAPY